MGIRPDVPQRPPRGPVSSAQAWPQRGALWERSMGLQAPPAEPENQSLGGWSQRPGESAAAQWGWGVGGAGCPVFGASSLGHSPCETFGLDLLDSPPASRFQCDPIGAHGCEAVRKLGGPFPHIVWGSRHCISTAPALREAGAPDSLSSSPQQEHSASTAILCPSGERPGHG